VSEPAPSIGRICISEKIPGDDDDDDDDDGDHDHDHDRAAVIATDRY